MSNPSENQALNEQGTDASKPDTDGSDRPFMDSAIPHAVLKQQLDSLDISIEAGELERACTAAQESMGPAAPGKRCKFIFKELDLRGVRVSQMHWRRFDQRRLPAIIFHDQQWQFAEHAEQGQFRLTSATGLLTDASAQDLNGAMVLWIQSLDRERGNQDEASFFGNSAAKLVLGEVFKTKRWVREILVASVIINVLAVFTSLFAMQVYDRVVPTLAYATLYTLVGGMVIVFALSWTLKRVRARILDSVSTEVDRTVSQKVFDHVIHLQLDTRPRSLGTLAAQVGGLDMVRQFFTSGVIFALVDMPFALMFMAFIAFIGGPIVWVYVLLMPIALILGFYAQGRLRNLMRDQQIRTNERQGMLVDVIQGTESIRSTNSAWRFSEEWKNITSTIAGYNIQQKALSNFATNTTGTIASAAYICALVVGVGQIAEGNLTMGALIACSILGGRVIAPVSQSVQYMTQWQSVAQALKMVSAVLNLETERPEGKTLIVPDQIPKRIELEELSFSYPDSPMKHLSIAKLTISAGERVAILGPIGSGKSTLLKVIGGLYRPSAGRIRHGLADLWEIDPNAISSYLAYLPQNVHLFKGTLRSNILMAGAVSDSQLLQTCKMLGVDRIASDSPQGMELAITEGGEGVSGGQRQLIGLARLFVAQPRIWLLDEPTASLDNQTEEQVIAAIEAKVGPEDILIISTHRPKLASKLADRVLVMRRGEIMADGPPSEILNKENNLRQKAQNIARRRGKVNGPGGNC